MPVAVLLPLDTWQNFYVIVGTAAATLTGLMFVVITLIAQLQAQIPIPPSRSHITVFTTSNVFHFGAVLLAAGILSAPWQALWPAGLLLGLAVLAGVTYMLIVLWLARHRLDINRCSPTGCGIRSCRSSLTPPSSSRRKRRAARPYTTA